MKVLFLTDSLSDLDGVGRYAHRLIAALERNRPGLEVHVLLARKHHPTSDSVPKHWTIDVALPPDWYFYMKPLRFWVWRILAGWKTWRAARSAVIVHAIKDFPHSMTALDGARLAGKPCIATAHGTYTVQPVKDPRTRKRATKTYHGFARLISVSQYTLNLLQRALGERALPTSKVVVIPNCVDAEHYVATRDVGDADWHGRDFVVTIGEVKERKGLHLALEGFLKVAAEHPTWHHYIVGRLSGDDYERRLRGMAQDAGFADRVHFLGNVTEDQKVDLLQRAGVFLHTPVTAADGGFEGFGLVYLEANAAGTPCIGTLDSGAIDAIRDERTGLLVEQTGAATAVALSRLMGDADLRERMGQAGREHAGTQTWDTNALEVLAIYDQELGR